MLVQSIELNFQKFNELFLLMYVKFMIKIGFGCYKLCIYHHIPIHLNLFITLKDLR